MCRRPLTVALLDAGLSWLVLHDLAYLLQDDLIGPQPSRREIALSCSSLAFDGESGFSLVSAGAGSGRWHGPIMVALGTSRSWAVVSNGFAIRRLNGAGNLRRSDSIRNNYRPGPWSRITVAQKPNSSGSGAVRLRAEPQPPGTEFLDAETKRQKSAFKRANARRDQNPRIESPEIPAGTPYLASCRRPAVCKDWVVGAPGLEPGTR